MGTATVLMLLGTLGALFLITLFYIEEKRHARFFEGFRSFLDAGILTCERLWHRVFRHAWRDFFRQTIHYIFHVVLKALVKGFHALEQVTERMLRSNRILARKANKERKERTMLDEIAEHKLTVALSEEEKRKHKARVLEKGF